MEESSSTDAITFSEAAAMIGRKYGLKPSVSTLWRWVRKGVGGELLEAIRIGRRYRTTPEAVERFLKSLPVSDMARHRSHMVSSCGEQKGFSNPALAAARESVSQEIERSKRQLDKHRPSKRKYDS